MRSTKLLNFFTIMLLIILQLGCSSKSNNRSNEFAKMDAPLRIKIQQLEKAGENFPLQCFVKLNVNLDEITESKIISSGVKIITVINRNAVVEGEPESILNLAAKDIVNSISLSQNR